jgi:hypothetical protein
MASIIGISIKNILYNELTYEFLHKYFPTNWNWNYSVMILSKNHTKGLFVTKQLNDKERISAAIENISIRKTIKLFYG